MTDGICALERTNGYGYPDPHTAELRRLAMAWIDAQQSRLVAFQRELTPCTHCDQVRAKQKPTIEHANGCLVGMYEKAENLLSGRLTRTLRKHPLWSPFLSNYPGLGGAHTALIIGTIRDPRRFPGQRCTIGHYSNPDFPVGAPCPHAGDEPCPGTMLPPRPGTGVRSIWHYLGLHVVDGRLPKRRKGVQSDWNGLLRTSVLMPDAGLAAQIVRLRTPKYREVYDAAKLRLQNERADGKLESGHDPGAPDVPERSDVATVIEEFDGSLRPFQIEQRARTIAAKAFLGDLLTTWKELLA